jgi:hypothetical protein
MCTGLTRDVVVASPSWPLEFAPHANGRQPVKPMKHATPTTSTACLRDRTPSTTPAVGQLRRERYLRVVVRSTGWRSGILERVDEDV